MFENIGDIKKGEVRELSPEEIGSHVRKIREARGIKRMALAYDAGVSEKTLERLENGHRVSKEVYRKIAIVLGFSEDVFIGPRYRPSEDELIDGAVKNLAELSAENFLLDAKPFKNEWDMRAVLNCWGATLVDYTEIEGKAADLAACFQQNLVDCKDIAHDIPEAARRDACRSLLAEVQEIERHGCVVRYVTYEPEFCWGPRPSKMPVSAIMMLPRNNWQSVKQLAVPRKITDFD